MQAVSDGANWMVRIEDGAELFDELARFASEHHVRAAALVEGIGMFRRAEIGYWNGREYAPHRLEVPHEVVALHGSIAEVDGAPSLHLHAGLAGADHRLIGGHLLRAQVAVLIEAHLTTFPSKVFGRPLDESFGLRRLDLQPGPTE